MIGMWPPETVTGLDSPCICILACTCTYDGRGWISGDQLYERLIQYDIDKDDGAMGDLAHGVGVAYDVGPRALERVI